MQIIDRVSDAATPLVVLEQRDGVLVVAAATTAA